MRSTLVQAAILLVVAGALALYFSVSRPPKLSGVADSAKTVVAPKLVEPKSGEPKPAEAKPAEIKAAETKPAEPKPAEAKPAPVKAPEPAPAASAPAPKSTATPPAPIPAAAPGELSEKEKHGNFKYIDLQEAAKIHKAQSVNGQQVIFIDARIYVVFTDGHVEGAMHVDKKYFDGAAPAKVRQYLPGCAVVVYCNGGDCSDSEAVVQRLQALNLGIGPYFIMKAGFEDWKKAGLPVAKGGDAGFQ